MPAVLGQLVPGVSFPLHVPISRRGGQNRGSSRTISEIKSVKEKLSYEKKFKDSTYLLQIRKSIPYWRLPLLNVSKSIDLHSASFIVWKYFYFFQLFLNSYLILIHFWICFIINVVTVFFQKFMLLLSSGWSHESSQFSFIFWCYSPQISLHDSHWSAVDFYSGNRNSLKASIKANPLALAEGHPDNFVIRRRQNWARVISNANMQVLRAHFAHQELGNVTKSY